MKRLLAGKVVELGFADSFSHESDTAKKLIKPWQSPQWCFPEVTPDFVAAMKDALDLYAASYDEKRPVVCFDESPKQMIDEVRTHFSTAPGRPKCKQKLILRR